jgi:hypothetical protein
MKQKLKGKVCLPLLLPLADERVLKLKLLGVSNQLDQLNLWFKYEAKYEMSADLMS